MISESGLPTRLWIVTAIAFFFATYWKTFAWLWERAFAPDSYYSHAVLVPFISGYLVWQRRDVLSQTPPARSLYGLVIIILALVAHLASVMLDVYFTSGFSIAALLFGLTLYLFGWPVTRQLLFPLGFLLFMFPLPAAALSAVSVPMKLFATKAGAAAMGLVGVPVIQEGYQLHFNSGSLVIGNPCSGLRSLIALMALGSLFAYFYDAPMWKRIALFLASVPAAIFSNVARVILLSLVVSSFGSEGAAGLFHDVSGFLVFAIALGMLFGTGKLLKGATDHTDKNISLSADCGDKKDSNDPVRTRITRIDTNYPKPQIAQMDTNSRGLSRNHELYGLHSLRRAEAGRALGVRYRIVILLLTVSAILTAVLNLSVAGHTDPARVSELPLFIGEFSGRELPVDQSIKDILETPNVMMREYVGPGGVPVTLAIVYYEQYRVSFHLPEGCMTGIGSVIMADERESLGAYGENDMPLVANNLILQQPGGKEHVYYFFVVGDLITPSYARMRFYLMKQHLKGRSRGAALVRFSTKVGNDQDEKIVYELEDFIREFAPNLPHYLG